MQLPDELYIKLLTENDVLTDQQLKEAETFSKLQNISLHESLIQKDFVSDENLGRLIADYLKLPFVLLSKVSIKDDILHIVPSEIVQREKVIAYGVKNHKLELATSNPDNIHLFELIGQKVGAEIVLAYATERDINECLRLFKKDISATIAPLIGDGSLEKDTPVEKIVDHLIENGYEQKASDVHIEPSEEFCLIRFRIDGVLSDVIKLPRNLHDQIVTRIKVASRLRTDEHFSAQDGKMQIKLEAEELDIRVSIVPIVDGEKVVLRLLTSHFRQFGLTDLGMGDGDLAKVRNGFMKPYGMILSTGPTGSGKTTSIYSILKILNTRERNIATIEDPVEYDIEGINQIQVNQKTNLTFAEGLRSILRQDPDIIYVGEIRDEETASIAINSATTGHLVVSTLHTNDAATAFVRLIDMNVEPFLVSSTVNTIIGQRLVRKNCEMCKVSYTMTPEELGTRISAAHISTHFGKTKEVRMYKGKGCAVCHNTGYLGRIGIFEVLELSDEIQELVNRKADSEEILKKAKELGMTTMLDDGLDKVQEGITTLDEIMRAVQE